LGRCTTSDRLALSTGNIGAASGHLEYMASERNGSGNY
jgi:hypothetical protein